MMKYLAALLFLISFIYAENLRAEEQEDFSSNPIAVDESQQESKINKSDYVKPTIKNLANLYWKMGANDLRNPQYLDNYLKITECGIYSRFYHNEFEWQNIRDATKEILRESVDSIPQKFFFKTELQLQRYDFGKQEFPIHEEDKFIGVRRLQMSNNDSRAEICFERYDLEGFPKNAILNLEKPLNLISIYVPRDRAQKFIDGSVSKYQDMTNKQQMFYYQRPVYIHFYLTTSAFSRMYYSNRGKYYGEFIGRVDRIEIYTDTRGEDLLWAKDYIE